MNQGVIRVKGKRAVLAAYGLLLLCLTFTLGYLLGSGRGETQLTVTTVEAPAEPSVQEPVTDDEAAGDFPLDLNTATQAQLEQLPGIGPELAKRILAYRQTNGPFVTTEQLMDVEGIGEKRYAAMEQLVCIGGVE